ncbi:hypothetical protein GCM10017786_26620 [Amycolatopsis deserti]|uniref:Uncharacterized protein n=1 Tax=Amycolatopsis deserti TaxID=185696 RepID=A0ABQ3ISQ2_9PSEU|nr:hypothetical protein GCM10017786_26620 [Amycolatopsis deserti]
MRVAVPAGARLRPSPLVTAAAVEVACWLVYLRVAPRAATRLRPSHLVTAPAVEVA